MVAAGSAWVITAVQVSSPWRRANRFSPGERGRRIPNRPVRGSGWDFFPIQENRLTRPGCPHQVIVGEGSPQRGLRAGDLELLGNGGEIQVRDFYLVGEKQLRCALVGFPKGGVTVQQKAAAAQLPADLPLGGQFPRGGEFPAGIRGDEKAHRIGLGVKGNSPLLGGASAQGRRDSRTARPSAPVAWVTWGRRKSTVPSWAS